MSNLPKRQFVRRMVRIRNPGKDVLIVWVEPWSERYDLASHETLDLAFVGPDVGFPELLPSSDVLSVYGWEGSEFIALMKGRVAGRQPTVDEIVRQELDIAKEHVRRNANPLPAEEIVTAQHLLDARPGVDADSQKLACDLAGNLTRDLANCFERSEPATTLLWQIVGRLVRTRGLVLAEIEESHTSEIWESSASVLADLLLEHSISALPDDPDRIGRTKDESPTKPLPSQRGSPPTRP